MVNPHAPPMEVTVQVETCKHCHHTNLVPTDLRPGSRVLCWKCNDSLRPWSKSLHNNKLAALFAAGAILFYIPAMTIPMMGFKKFGFSNEVGLVEGVVSLIHHGNVLVGTVLLLCSVFLPLGKVAGLLILSTKGVALSAHKRSLLFHIIEWTGRFSVLDLLLVGVLVAIIKIGDMVSVFVSPGLFAFAMVVFLSLLSSWAFDPETIWRKSHD